MTCQVVNSQSQLQARLPSLPQKLPTTQAEWTAFLNTLNAWGPILQQESHAPNVLPSQFQTFASASSVPVLGALTLTSCTAAIDASTVLYGTASLKVVPSAAPATVAFSGDPITIASASRWFCGFEIIAPDGATGSLTVTTSGGTSITENFSVGASPDWQGIWGLFDLRACADRRATWSLQFTTTATVWLDGLQMNAIGSPLGKIPKFAGTQMVTGALAYAENLDQVPNGTEYSRTLAAYVAEGVPYNYQGVYDAATAYAKGAEVTYTGNYYLATQPSTGETPASGSSYWQLLGPVTQDNLPDGTDYQRLIYSPQSATSLPFNGTFSQWAVGQTYPDGWSAASDMAGTGLTPQRVSGGYNGAPYALALGPNSSANGGGIASLPFAVTPGEIYEFRLRVQSNVANPASMYLRVRWYNAEPPSSSPSGPAYIFESDMIQNSGPSAANAWQIFAGNATAPAAARFGIVCLYNWTSSADATLTFGQVTIAPRPQIYTLSNNTNVPNWVHLGTLILQYASSATLTWHAGTGYNTNANQQAIATMTVRSSNDTAAPNLSGLSYYTTGGAPVQGLKAAATGGSTSASNNSWELYAYLGEYSVGTLVATVNYAYGDDFTFSGATASDPGAASSSVVVGGGGNIFDTNALLGSERAPTTSIINYAVTAPYGITATASPAPVIYFEIEDADLPAGETTVPVLITVSAVGSMFMDLALFTGVVDMSQTQTVTEQVTVCQPYYVYPNPNPAGVSCSTHDEQVTTEPWTTAGNLVSAMGNGYGTSFQIVESLGVGTYTVAFYDHEVAAADEGYPTGSGAPTQLTLSLTLLKR